MDRFSDSNIKLQGVIVARPISQVAHCEFDMSSVELTCVVVTLWLLSVLLSIDHFWS